MVNKISMTTTGIILAGGLGTRLRPLTDTTPKPLLSIQGKPIMQYAIENLKKHGIKNIILAISYHADKIKDYFGNGEKFGVNITYSIEDTPLGTGGAVKQASKDINGSFALVWGDNMMDIDWTSMFNIHSESLDGIFAKITMALTHRDDVEHFGVAKLDGNKIESFIEKPRREDAPSNLINAGAFVIEPEALTILPEGKSSIERDCFEKLAKEGVVFSFTHNGQWFPTDTLEKYEFANKNFRS